MDRLSDLLPRALRQRGLHEQATASLLVTRANRWIAEHIAKHASTLQAQKFQHGEIVIEADNAIALQECAQAKEPLLAHLRRDLPEEIKVRGVRVVRSSGR